jgi:hypothetical protein
VAVCIKRIVIFAIHQNCVIPICIIPTEDAHKPQFGLSFRSLVCHSAAERRNLLFAFLLLLFVLRRHPERSEGPLYLLLLLLSVGAQGFQPCVS